MKDSTILTEQHIFKAKILPQLKKITRAVLSTLMRFSMSGYNNYPNHNHSDTSSIRDVCNWLELVITVYNWFRSLP